MRRNKSDLTILFEKPPKEVSVIPLTSTESEELDAFVHDQELTDLKNKVDAMMRARKFAVWKQFMKEKTIYKENATIRMQDLMLLFKQWFYTHDPSNAYNILLDIGEVCMRDIDARIIVKKLNYCKSCDKKYYKGCCDKSDPKHGVWGKRTLINVTLR